MSRSKSNSRISPERGVAVISLDAEQIWGHLDLLDQHLYSERYPNTPAAYEHLLRMLCSAGMSATWLVVGGLCLRGSEGPGDFRLRGLPTRWSGRVPAGNEMTRPLWYRRSFIQQLTRAHPAQDVGLHGGLTHLIWTDRDATPDAVGAELKAGLVALNELGSRPRSFSFPRNRERYHALLAEHAFICYRGRDPMPSAKLGQSLSGSILRMLEEMSRLTPRPVWPVEALPGLWNIPASMFLYPIGDSRSRIVPMVTRLERVRLGLEAAIRHRGIFHFCLHPANLAESVRGFSLFEEILEQLIRARELGNVEILTMTEVAERMAAQTATNPAAQPVNANLPAQPSLARIRTAESSFLRSAGD